MQPVQQISLVTIAERPDTVPAVSRWLWKEWGHAGGHSLEEETARVAEGTSVLGPEQCLVLLAGGEPVAACWYGLRKWPAGRHSGSLALHGLGR